MKYMIEFDLPDNDTVLREIKTADVAWGIWGYSGCTKAKPVQRWIPVTERLPKPEDEVLLTMDYKGCRYVEMGNVWSDGTVHCYTDEYLTPDGRKYRKVFAWMPLPTPYREGGQYNGSD